jgi:DNA-binding response OmpR family regulator
LRGAAPWLDGALLEVKLHEARCFPVAAILKARDIRFIFMTGYDEISSIPPAFRAAPLVCKPFEEDELRAALDLSAHRPAGDHARSTSAPAALSFDQHAARGQHPELSPATEMPSHGYREGRTLRRRYSTSALP